MRVLWMRHRFPSSHDFVSRPQYGTVSAVRLADEQDAVKCRLTCIDAVRLGSPRPSDSCRGLAVEDHTQRSAVAEQQTRPEGSPLTVILI